MRNALLESMLAWMCVAAIGCDSAPVTDTDGGHGTDGGGTPVDGGHATPDSGPQQCPAATLPALSSTDVIGAGITRPTYVTQPPGITGDELYVVEKWGRILIVRAGAVAGTFLDIRSAVTGSATPGTPDPGDETGLLGLAFHPDYATNGRFFVRYTVSGGNDIVREYHRSDANHDVADPDPVDTPALLDIDTLQDNHNGGMIAFWPETGGGTPFLYVGIGDGGNGCDTGGGHGTNGNGQNSMDEHGKILRLDPDSAAGGYAAAGNPFNGTDGLTTIWSWGLRNPWRFSFDRMNGDLYIGDVGQNAYEEIDYQPGTSNGGENYGWRQLEGNCGSDASGCDTSYAGMCLTAAEQAAEGFVAPVQVERGDNPPGVLGTVYAITGGYVYRGTTISGLAGWYIYGGYGSNVIAALRICNGRAIDVQAIPGLSGGDVVSFGQDNAGEIYIVYQGSGGGSGTIARIIGG